MSATVAAAPTVVIGADGRREVELDARTHAKLHLALLHQASAGWVEIAGGRRDPATGKCHIYTRRRRDAFLAGGAHPDAGPRWLDALADRALNVHEARGEEAFVGVCPRTRPAGAKDAVDAAAVAFVDVDGSELDALHALLERRPAHLVVESAGSGGLHAYWLLDRLLFGDQIEEANRRIIEAVDGDRAAKDRSRVLRLAGTTNHKTGRLAQIRLLDLHAPAWNPAQLLDGLLLPEEKRPAPATRPRARYHPRDGDVDLGALRDTPIALVYETLTGRPVRRGLQHCAHLHHEDRDPSMNMGWNGKSLWHCHGCGRGGGPIDMASAVLGGPTGPELARDGRALAAAARHLAQQLGA